MYGKEHRINRKINETTCLRRVTPKSNRRKKNKDTGRQTFFPAARGLGNYNLSLKLRVVSYHSSQRGTSGETSRLIFKREFSSK